MRRAVLLVPLLVLALAPAAHARSQVDSAATGLATNPVYVAPDARPGLSGAEKQRIENAIARAGTPVYTAILPAGARDEAGGSTSEVLRQIAQRLNREGTYAVVVGNQFRAASTSLERGEAGKLATEAFDAHHQEGLTATLVDFVHRVGQAADGGGSGAGGGGSGGGIGTGGIIALVVILGGGALLLFGRSRRRRRDREEEMRRLRDFARDDLVALGDDVRAIDVDIDMPGADPRAKAHLSKALELYDRAERGYDQARSPGDFEPITSAVEEGRWEMTCARAALAGEPEPERRPPCFFDPRHGPSARDVEWAPEGGTPRPVPACAADAQRVEAGLAPHIREIELAGGARTPYFNGPRFLTPWAGGYFGGFGSIGGFGLGGFLPGLLFGEMLGGAFGGWGGPGVGWGGGYDGGGDFGGDPGGGLGGDFGGGDLGDFGGGDFGGGDF